MTNDEKRVNTLKQKMGVEKENLHKLENKFKDYLNSKSKNVNIFNNISKNLEMLSQNAEKVMESEDTTMNEILIVDSLSTDVHKIISEISLKIRDSFEILKASESVNVNDEKQDMVAMAPKDSKILATSKYNNVEWKFDYFYDDKINGENRDHGIKNNGKTIYCQDGGLDKGTGCYCFYRIDQGMKPKSGIYKIKMKVDKIYGNMWNVIGMTINTDKRNNAQQAGQWFDSFDYIGWSAPGLHSADDCPNGFLCGTAEYMKKNTFVLNKFQYESNNNNYQQAAAPINSKDVVILIYDSDLNILSLSKENDSSFDAKLTHLPKNKTLYWFVGHFEDRMSVTIV